MGWVPAQKVSHSPWLGRYTLQLFILAANPVNLRRRNAPIRRSSPAFHIHAGALDG
jgi:hypothetical protein